MKVSELFEAADSMQEITVEKVGDDKFVVNSKAKSGMTLDAIMGVWHGFEQMKGVKITSKAGLPLDFNRMFKNRPNGFVMRFEKPEGMLEKIQAGIEKSKASTIKEYARRAKHKAEAPKRRKEAAKFDAQLRKEIMAEYDKKYGKGTWKRVTYRQEGGDDGYQYVVRVDGRVKWNGLTQRQAAFEKEQEVDAIAKREGLGKYATVKEGVDHAGEKLKTLKRRLRELTTDYHNMGYTFGEAERKQRAQMVRDEIAELEGSKKIDETRKPRVTKDYSPLGQLKALPQPIGINGGSYTYWVDVTKTPLVFKASDGDVVEKAKTLEDIAKWMEKWAAQLWLEFLNDEESLENLRSENIVRIKKGAMDQREHEAGMRG